jgi:DNA-binding MarR family transcriptional regulator
MDQTYFRTTKKYREYYLLHSIEKNAAITQRQLSLELNAVVSLVNQDIKDGIKNGYIAKKTRSKTRAHYVITKKGIQRKRYLNLEYFDAVQKLYDEAKEHLLEFLKGLENKGLKTIVLYGAGEVAALMLRVLKESQLNINVPCIIDDDLSKQGLVLEGVNILPKTKLLEIDFKGILISSYLHNQAIYDQLIALKIDPQKIIRYFT